MSGDPNNVRQSVMGRLQDADVTNNDIHLFLHSG